MKKLLVLMMLLVLCNTSRAQIEKVVIEPGQKDTHPKAVLDSIKSQFPEPISQTLSVLTARAFGEQWNVNISKESEEMMPTYYEVILKAKNGTQTAVYDSSGKLIRLKQVIKEVDLPEKIANVLNSKYADWQVTDKEERITNANKLEVTYKINLKKGVLRKTIFLDPEGNIKVALPV